MGSRHTWSVLFVGAATLWLVVALWLSLVTDVRGLDRLALGLALAMQLTVVMAWDLFPRLPLWMVAGHGLIMVSLALGLLITAPGGGSPMTPGGLPWHVVGLVPAGLAMIVAAALRWERSEGLVHH